MASIADVYVDVLPNTSKIASGIERAFRGVDSDVRKAAKRWRTEIDRELKGVKVKVDADISQAKRKVKQLQDDSGEIQVQVDADTVAAEAKIDAIARDRKATIDIDVDKDRIGRMGLTAGTMFGQAATQGASTAMGGATTSFSALSTSLTSLGGSGAIAAVGIAALLPTLTAVAGVAAAAAGALALIPAALAGAGLGIGALVVGFSGLTDAYTAVSDAAKTADKDQTSHARSVRSAYRTVESATRSLNSSINSEKQAQKDVARARKDARKELEEINDELRHGALDETQATIDLQKAREELATGTFETSTDYQQAQLNVLKAEQSLKDAHEGNIDLQGEVNDKRAKGVDSADAVVAAEERLATAQRNTADAQTALADAQQRLIETQDETSTAAQKAADAMGGLSPAGQEFVNTLLALTPVWEGFRNSIQDSLFANLGPTLTATVDALLPAVTPGLTRIAGAFNTMFQEIGEWLQDPENLAILEGIVDNIATAFEKLVPAIQPMADAFASLVSVGSGFLPGLAKGLSDAAIAFSEWISKAAESGELQRFIQTGLDIIKQLAPLVPSIVELFKKLVPLGEAFMPILVRMVDNFIDLMGQLSRLWTILIGISPVLNGTLPVAFGLVKDAVQGLTTALNFLNDAFNFEKDLVGNIATEFQNVLEPRVSALKIIFEELTGKMRGYFQEFADKVREHVPVLDQWVDMHQNAFDKIKGFFEGFKIFLPGFIEFVKQKLLDMIPEPIKQLLKKIWPEWGGEAAAPQGPMPYKPGGPGVPPGPSVAPPPGPNPATPSGGVPLIQNPNGTWTSSNEAWAHLIERESGGRNIRQGITDINSGGNEAEGIFQITPKTWKLNGGEEFAPTPIDATPQQQAVIAARIFNRNPTGKDWGAGSPGRESAAELGAGLGAVSAPTPNLGAPGAVPTPAMPVGPSPNLAVTTARIPYGLPAGTDIRQGAAGFPQWVYDLGAQFNLKPSTYGGHQEGSGQNQGIDWWGTTEDLQRFAEYLEANPALAEQVIFSNPKTGEKTGMAGGQKVGPGTSQPNYYNTSWAGHEKHVHTRFSASPGGAAGDQHVIPLATEIPPGQRAKNKDAGQDFAKQFGESFLSGIGEVFGFGDIFKDPTEFGLFKIFKSIMGLKLTEPKGGQGGQEGTFTGGGGGGGLGGLLQGLIPQPFGQLNIGGPGNAPGQFMPLMPQAGGGGGSVGDVMASPFGQTGQQGIAGPGNAPMIDNSISINGNLGVNPQNMMDTLHAEQNHRTREPLRSFPK